MNMLDTYMQEVGKRLPRKNRADLQAEIRSNLEALLEDRSQQTGRAIDEALTAEVLQEYGSPEKVAQSYQTTPYLIGPRLYPFFTMVLRIVMTVLVAVSLGGFIIGYFSSGGQGADFISMLAKYGLELVSGLIAAFGNIVLVFAILERVLPEKEFGEKSAEWNPAQLSAEPDPDQVKHGELIFEVLFAVLGLVVLNVYTDAIAFYIFSDDTLVKIPALASVFYRYLPWINLIWVLQIALDLYLLSRGYWKTASRLVNIALEVAGIALAWVMLTGPSLVSITAADLAATPVAGSADVLAQMFRAIPIIVLSILIIVQSIEVVQQIVRLVRQQSSTRPFVPKV